jgi:nitroreductase
MNLPHAMNPHLRPWAIASSEFPEDGYASDQLEFLLGYAILAPSPHNSQPWLFRINVNDVEIHADRRRALRVVDPFDRELTISCGAALYNLRIATEYFGRSCAVDVLAQPEESSLLARLTLRLHAQTSSEDVLLFHAITRRRSHRAIFRPELVPGDVMVELAEAASREGAWLQVITADETRHHIGQLVAEADRMQWANPEFRRELSSWLRTDAEHHGDGIAVHDFGVKDWLSFAGPLWVRTFNRGNHEAALDADIAEHSPVLALLGTNEDHPRAWLEAGQAMESVLLHAQANGLSASSLNQPIEIPELRPRLADLFGREGNPQVLLRLGYGLEVPPTPRRSVRSLLLKHDTSMGVTH